jgi:hypothetical protein
LISGQFSNPKAFRRGLLSTLPSFPPSSVANDTGELYFALNRLELCQMDSLLLTPGLGCRNRRASLIWLKINNLTKKEVGNWRGTAIVVLEHMFSR